MNPSSTGRARLIRLTQLAMVLPMLVVALFSASHASAQGGPNQVFLPFLTKSGQATQPTQPTPPPTPPPGGTLPADVVATWFSGVIPPPDFYNPTTGEWRATNGLGQMYRFNADASFVYAGFLRIQNGACRTEVSTYKQGQASIAGTTLTLKPTIAKTRTVVVCGSQSDTTTEGPFEPVALGWRVADDGLGRPKLFIQEGAASSEYYRQGMLTTLVGSWSMNAVPSDGFYNPQTGAWATPANDGAWFRFAADGTYQYGEYGHGQDEQGCPTVYWVYQTGTMKVSGGQLSYKASSGRARVEHLCGANVVEDEPYVDTALYEFVWELHDLTTAPRLAISPLGQFKYFVFNKE